MSLKSVSFCNARACKTHTLARVRQFGSRSCALGLHNSCACASLPHFHARVCLHRSCASVRLVTSEPIRARYTVASYWLTLVRHAHTSVSTRQCEQTSLVMPSVLTHLPAMSSPKVYLPPFLAAHVLHHTRVVKNTKVAHGVQSAPSKHTSTTGARTCASAS
ncbi:hypothetical protein Hanom_Chr02g00139731 [Helianthus anomalus]